MEVIPTIPLAIALAIPFLVTFLALHFILFRPLLTYLREREHAVKDARTEAETLEQQIDERMRTLEGRLVGAREEVTDLRAVARARAIERQNAILGEARSSADARVKSAIEEINVEHQRATATVTQMATDLSQDIASRVLGRPVES